MPKTKKLSEKEETFLARAHKQGANFYQRHLAKTLLPDGKTKFGEATIADLSEYFPSLQMAEIIKHQLERVDWLAEVRLSNT